MLALTANNTLQSRVNELDRGADDYIAKPFEIEELEARMRMLIRRSGGQSSPVITCGDLSYSSNGREFTVTDKGLALTPLERAVLEVLVRKSRGTVTKQALAQSLSSRDQEASTDIIEIYVHRVRKTPEHSPATIVTLRGLGYLLAPKGALQLWILALAAVSILFGLHRGLRPAIRLGKNLLFLTRGVLVATGNGGRQHSLLHLRVVRPATAFGHHPHEVLDRVLDVAGLAVRAVPSVDLQAICVACALD